jgi:hypothetical protein
VLATLGILATLVTGAVATYPRRTATTGGGEIIAPSAPARPAEAAPVFPDVARVTVDPADVAGPFNNPARYHNQSGPVTLLNSAQLGQVELLAPRVVRVWIKPERYYDHTTGTFDFDYRTNAAGNTFYDYLDQVADQASEIVGNVDQCAEELLDTPELCRHVLLAGVLHYARRYPALRYVEIFNEPDKTWPPTGSERAPLPIDRYYSWYRIGYSVVNEVNVLLSDRVPLQVGGPAAYTFNPDYLESFLDRYRADPDPRKRLDFLSYHQYRRRENPAAVRDEKTTVQRWLRRRGLDPRTPVFVTEYGVFPGASSGTTFAEDLLTQAAAMAALGYYYTLGGMDMVMHWVYRHPEHDRKSMLADTDDGAVYPYFNLVRMQGMLKRNLIGARSDALDDSGLGVHALATMDNSGLAVLLTNYQWTTGRTGYQVELSVAGTPTVTRGRQLRIQRYLVDEATSNYAHDPANSELRLVEERRIAADTPLALTFPLGRNAMSLLVVTPI